MRIRGLFAIAVLCLTATPVSADIFKCVETDGHVTYSNVPDKNCKKLNLEPASGNQPASKPASKSPTPSTFPKVDENAQKARDNDRRRILEGELAAEQKNLEQAKKDLAAQDESALPEERLAPQTTCTPVQQCTPITLKDGKTGQSCKTVQSCVTSGGGINEAKVQDRLQPFKDKVALHERNIEAIQKELARLR